jgi:hypothetical protein
MSIKNDIDELLWYTTMNARESAGEEWADELLVRCRRVYEQGIRDKAIVEVDKQLRRFEKQLAKEGKVIRDRLVFRTEQVESFVKHYLTFDEWLEAM